MRIMLIAVIGGLAGLAYFNGGLAALAYINPRLILTVDNRTEIWTECMRLIAERPLTGWGISGVMDNIGVLHGHNIWIGMLVFFGVPGLVAYLLWRGALYKGMIQLYAGGSNLAVLLIASQVFFVVHGIVDITWVTPQGGALFFCLCGITAGLAENVSASTLLEKKKVRKRYFRKRRRLDEADIMECQRDPGVFEKRI